MLTGAGPARLRVISLSPHGTHGTNSERIRRIFDRIRSNFAVHSGPRQGAIRPSCLRDASSSDGLRLWPDS